MANAAHANIKRYLLWGSAGQAKVLRECLQSDALELLAVFDSNPQATPAFSDVPLIGDRQTFEPWLKQQGDPETIGFLIAIGGNGGRARLEIDSYLRSLGLVALPAIHSTAFVADSATLGRGCQILAQAAVCVEVTMGHQCIVNTSASVDHECRLGDGVHIAPGAHLAGCITVGDCSMIGTGATVLPRVTIGRDVIVGAGAVVLHDVADGLVVAGNPAREIKK